MDRGNAATIHLPYLRRNSLIARLGTLPPTRRWWLSLDFESLSLYLSFLFNERAKRCVETSDVVATFYPTDSLLFSRYSARRGVPSLYHCNGWGGPSILCWKRFFKYDRSSVYIAISETTKREIERRAENPLEGVVTFGVPEEFYDLKSDKSGDRTILFVGRVEVHKGVFQILEIYRELVEKYPLKLIFVGEGAALSALKSKATRYGWNDVEFSGAIPHRRVAEYLKRASLFLAPSEYESGFTSILEAMAAGIPVVASDIPAAREMAGGSTVLLPRPDLEAWVTAAERLLNDDTYREEVIERQKKRAEDYRYDVKVKEFESYLEEAVSRGPRGI
jgi:glycosyltransferase involved in cell wall biosynthesis